MKKPFPERRFLVFAVVSLLGTLTFGPPSAVGSAGTAGSLGLAPFQPYSGPYGYSNVSYGCGPSIDPPPGFFPYGGQGQNSAVPSPFYVPVPVYAPGSVVVPGAVVGQMTAVLPSMVNERFYAPPPGVYVGQPVDIGEPADLGPTGCFSPISGPAW